MTPVRFYFVVSVSCLIPRDPNVNSKTASWSDWETSYLEGLRQDVEAKLPKDGFHIEYRKHSPIDRKRRLYKAEFVVSVLHFFSRTQISRPKKAFGNFSVGAKSFAKAKAMLQEQIADALKRDYVITAVAYEYAASRTFVFQD